MRDDGLTHDTQVRLATINSRSIKKNDQILLRELIHLNLRRPSLRIRMKTDSGLIEVSSISPHTSAIMQTGMSELEVE